MRRNFIFFLACCFLAASAFGQVLNEPFATTTIPAGWSDTAVTGSGWQFTPTIAGWGVSGTSDHTPGGGTNFALVDFSTTGGVDSNAILIAPGVNITSLSSPVLTFAYESYYTGSNPNFIYNTLDVEAWNGTMWVNVTTLQGNTAQGWEVLFFPITPALTYSSGDSVRVRFVADDGGDRSSYENDLLIDDVMIMEQPTCVAPNNVVVSNIMPTSANVTWMQPVGTPLSWEVAYGVSGTAPGSGGSVFSATIPATLNLLMGNTSYDVYVRAICAPGDTSTWSAVANFRTPCAAATVPYSYPFTGYITNDPCWAEARGALTANSTLNVGSSTWAEDGFANNGTTNAAGINVYGNRNEWLITQSIDLGTGTAYQAEFDVAVTAYANSNAGNFDADDEVFFLISTDNGTTWSNANVLRSWAAGNEPSNTGDHIIVDLTAYSGVVKFAFHAKSTSTTRDNDFFVDNFEIAPLQACLPPTMLNASNLTPTSADLGWMTSSGATMWEIEYGPTGFTRGNGTSLVAVNNPFFVTGLTPSTNYSFYVRSICAPGDTSIWSSAGNFATPCPPATVPYLYDFTDYIDNNPCWSEAQGILTPNSTLNYGASSWVEDGFANNGSSDAAKMNIYSTRAEWLISESIDLGTGTAYQLEFDVALTDFGNTAATSFDADDTAAVVISTDNGMTWSDANVLQMWTAGNEPSATGDRIVIDLSAYSGVIKIGFYTKSSTSGQDNDFFIDNFAILPLASASDLVINEIMYNPPEGGTDTLEFIEIYNRGTSAVNVNNFSLSGVTFTFPNVSIPSNGYYVVAINASAYNNVYGMAPDAIWTSGGLSNGGETILLLDAAGNTADSVRYDDGGVWPSGAAAGQPDGGGASLILCDPNSDNADGNNWQASTNRIGAIATLDSVFASPGTTNTCTSPGTDVTADQFVNVNSTYCNTATISGGFVVTNLSGNDASNVNYNITAGGLPIASGVIPVVLANSSDTILVGPVPVTTGSATLIAIVNAANDTDNSNDTLMQTITISNVTAATTVNSNVSCNGGNDGTAAATGANGIGTYTYAWSTGGTTNVVTGLGAGTYYVTVTDSIGCMAMDSVIVTEPASALAVVIQDNADGSATANATGGTGAYTYLWDANANNQTTMTASNLTNANTYSVTVTDANGCMAMDTVTIRVVGVQTLEEVSKLEIFPNPTSDNVFVDLELNKVQSVQISVYNAIGKRVLVQSLGDTQGTRVELPTAQLPAGVYHVQLTIGGEQLSRKLIVQK